MSPKYEKSRVRPLFIKRLVVTGLIVSLVTGLVTTNRLINNGQTLL